MGSDTLAVLLVADNHEMLAAVLHALLTNAVEHNDTDTPEIAVEEVEIDRWFLRGISPLTAIVLLVFGL